MNPRLWRSFLAVFLSFIFVLTLAGLAGAQVPSGVEPLSPQAAPELQLNKSNDNGAARPGGIATYRLQISNNGDGDALGTIVTDTLPLSTTWAGDTSGITPIIGSEGVITWNLGTVPPGAGFNFEVTLNVDPSMPTGGGQIGPNCAGITSDSPGDWDEGNNTQCSGTVDVWTDDVDLGVNTRADPGDPAPGQEYDSIVQVCNNRNTAAGPVTLTNTLPASTTLLSWVSGDSGRNLWNEVSRSGGRLVLVAPGYPATCNEVRVRLRVDSGAPIGTPLFNRAEIAVADDVDLNNQQNQYTAYVSGSRYDLEAREIHQRQCTGSRRLDSLSSMVCQPQQPGGEYALHRHAAGRCHLSRRQRHARRQRRTHSTTERHRANRGVGSGRA